MRALHGEIKFSTGKLVTGITVKAALLTQHLTELNPKWRVLEAVEQVANRVELGNGKELSASQLCERLGFDKESQWTPVADLSGGERRRLQLTRLLMDSPNVLLLDEPTNDFDIETLTELEDLLDSYSGTLLVISHDRYFLERVCDRFVGMLGDGELRDLPRGVEQYLEQREEAVAASNREELLEKGPSGAARERALKKDVARLERQLEKSALRISLLSVKQDGVAFDPLRLAEVGAELAQARLVQSELEEAWLVASQELGMV
jgi:ATP-binding cassette subfamily F protein uup